MSKAISVIFALLLLAGLGWLGWYLDWSSEYIAGILSFITTAFAAIYSHMTTKKREIESHKLVKEREIESRHFTEKRAAYMNFIDLLFNLIQEQKKEKASKNSKLSQKQEELMIKFKKEVLVWGSADVIQTYYQFEDACDPENPQYDPNQTFQYSEKLFRAIRKDLGHDDRNLKPVDLISLILKPEDRRKLQGNDNG